MNERMNKIIFSFLVLLPFSFIYAQDSSFSNINKNKFSSIEIANRNKLGIGFWSAGRDVYLFTASFNKALNKKNSLAVPVYYIQETDYRELSASVGYQHAFRAPEKHFNFILGSELNFNYGWYDKNYHAPIANQHGSFFCVDLIPTFWISNRLYFAIELKLGYGYLWEEKHAYIKYGYYSSAENGWQYRALPAFKILYDL
jgi:hypothetical protein